ncbi:MAG: AMP-binding protein [Xanthomonadaceae bacterium]|jgi:long-chain acyl-CoA synthetase|nr:AMP-binding protein [Xanthomonadaceae bacterium]
MNLDRPWLQSYPPGVPAEIDPDEYRSIPDILNASFDTYRQNPAYSNFGKILTYGEIDQLSAQFASYLLNVLKLKKGDRVAIMMPNCLQYPIAVFGTLRAGLTVMNVNPLYTARELKHQLEDSTASAVVVVDNFGHTLEEALTEMGSPPIHVVTTGLGDMLGAFRGGAINFFLEHLSTMVPSYRIHNAVRFKSALARGKRHALRPVEINSEDIAFLQYTGGTTGIAKGAMLTHRNLVANLQQVSAWIKSTGLEPGKEVVVTALPLYHIFALTANCLTFFKIGAFNYLITNPRDMKGFIRKLKGIRFTAFTGVNTLFNGMLNAPGFDKIDFSSFRFTLGGGMAVQRTVAERWKEVTGVTLIEAYGLTETSPAACANPLDLQEFNGSIGLPIPSTDACTKDDDGNILPIGEVGELCIRGPQVMKGYWRHPDETSKAIDSDGWLHTGDIAKIDEKGFVYIVDRKKDMILVSGFNVYPNEVEDVLALMPGVLEVAAIGVPEEKSGETVKVFIVRKNPRLTAAQVKSYARTNLTGYKRPRYIEFRDELPKSNVGKILRRTLRDEELAKRAAQASQESS